MTAPTDEILKGTVVFPQLILLKYGYMNASSRRPLARRLKPWNEKQYNKLYNEAHNLQMSIQFSKLRQSSWNINASSLDIHFTTSKEDILFRLDRLNGSTIIETASRIHGSAGPSALDAAAWYNMLQKHEEQSTRLANALATTAICISSTNMDPYILRRLTTSRLIPLDKNHENVCKKAEELSALVNGLATVAVVDPHVAVVDPHRLHLENHEQPNGSKLISFQNSDRQSVFESQSQHQFALFGLAEMQDSQPKSWRHYGIAAWWTSSGRTIDPGVYSRPILEDSKDYMTKFGFQS
ncbi:hypothetical protein GJ496_001002 [Pomphorhynchus laevis]|nr:hypothetical protein GJ496_001002 [Pomphorhynchus laevis]